MKTGWGGNLGPWIFGKDQNLKKGHTPNINTKN
jgi:hypothetical protein